MMNIKDTIEKIRYAAKVKLAEQKGILDPRLQTSIWCLKDKPEFHQDGFIEYVPGENGWSHGCYFETVERADYQDAERLAMGIMEPAMYKVTTGDIFLKKSKDVFHVSDYCDQISLNGQIVGCFSGNTVNYAGFCKDVLLSKDRLSNASKNAEEYDLKDIMMAVDRAVSYSRSKKDRVVDNENTDVVKRSINKPIKRETRDY